VNKTDTNGKAGLRQNAGARPRTPLGRRIHLLAYGKGDAPAAQQLAWLEQSGTEEARALVTQLREAMTQRDAHTADRLDAPVRHLEDPHARLVLAVWLCIAEACRHGMANSRSLWLGHDQAGRRGGIAGRLGGVSRATVSRALDALEASGALKRWKPPAHTSGIVKGLKHGQTYNVYLVRVIPREVARQVHTFWVSQKRRTSSPYHVPETSERAQPARPAQAPKPAAVAATPSRPDGRADAYDRHDALARFAEYLPPGRA
jgi:hypothetical protein